MKFLEKLFKHVDLDFSAKYENECAENLFLRKFIILKTLHQSFGTHLIYRKE